MSCWSKLIATFNKLKNNLRSNGDLLCTHSVEVPVKGNTRFVPQSGTGNLEISPECAIYSIFLERRKHLTEILTAPKLKTKKIPILCSCKCWKKAAPLDTELNQSFVTSVVRTIYIIQFKVSFWTQKGSKSETQFFCLIKKFLPYQRKRQNLQWILSQLKQISTALIDR